MSGVLGAGSGTLGGSIGLSELDVPANKGGLLVGDGVGNPVELTVGTDTHVLTADAAEASGVKWAAVAGGGGDVSAAASMTDNTLVRGDGGVKGVQGSGITVDDSDNVTGMGTLNGRTLATDGTKLDGIEALADVTDATNVGAAGAHMAGGTDVPVADGGTGRSSHTAYAVLCGGTGATTAQQSIAGVGTSGQVLTSNGAAALPTFQAAAGGAGADGNVAVTVYNDTGSTLNEGKAVYITGYKTGNEIPTVALAKSDAAATMPGFGIVQTNISNNSEGTVVAFGQLQGIDTSSWSVGDELFVDPSTAGDLTSTQPVSSDPIQKIGVVTRSNVTLGVLQIFGAGRSNAIPNFTAADKYWYGGTGGVQTEGAITAAARTVLDDATVAAMLVTLGAAPIVGEYPIGWLNDIMGWPDGSGYTTSTYQIPPLTAIPQPPSMEGMGNPGANDVAAGWTNCIVPRGYVAATHTLKVRIRCKWHTQQANTTHAIDLQAYEDGAGADICATAQQNITNAFANYDFTITDTNLVAGDQVSLLVACILDDTGGVAAQPITEITNITLVVS